MSHEHTFSVDTACDCGVMLSDYVKDITAENKRLRAALEATIERLESVLPHTAALIIAFARGALKVHP